MTVNFKCIKAFPIPGSQCVAKPGDKVEMTMGSPLYHRMRQKGAIEPLNDQDVTDESDWRAEFGDETVGATGTMQPPAERPKVAPQEEDEEPLGWTDRGGVFHPGVKGHEEPAEDVSEDGGTSEGAEEPTPAKGLTRKELMVLTIPSLQQYANNRGMTGLPSLKKDLVDHILEFTE